MVTIVATTHKFITYSHFLVWIPASAGMTVPFHGVRSIDMNVLFILFHVEREKEISKDCRLRMEAGARYMEKLRSPALVFFVGGGGMDISGAKRMKAYWERRYATPGVSLRVCEQSSTSVSNIKEIERVSAKVDAGKFSIITSSYHVRRIQELLSLQNLLQIDVLAAEDILSECSQGDRENMQKYMKSFAYKMKILRESLLFLLIPLEPIFYKIRRFTYKNLFL